jgi:preprotein translocase subunit SecD
MSTRTYKVRLIGIILIIFGGLAAVLAAGFAPKRGLDLEGGISVILTAASEDGVEPDVLQQTVDIIRDRIDSIGVAESEVSVAGTNNILIQLPGVENEEEALEVVGTTAQLTFRQVEEVIPAEADASPSPSASASPSASPTADGDEGKDGKGKDQDAKDDEATDEETPADEETDRPEVTEDKSQAVNGEEVVYPSAQEGEEGVLYRLAPAILTGDVVERAEAVVDPNLGNDWAVSIRMDGEGSKKWADFTSKLACLRDKGEQIKSQVAIVLDGKVESAAGMQDPAGAAAGGGVECGTGITGGDTQIDTATEAEAKSLALVLRTGALPLTLEQSEVRKVSATLGEESLNAGLLAGILGLALVMLYMLLYYRALGLVVWLGLALFTAALYTVLAILGETAGLTLTLAGVAGVIVSIGVTADSYIVAFERLKDEVRSGKSMRAAVDRGMKRAFKTILVADFVTGAAAIILYLLAVGPVKGFALTLGLATIIDVVVAFFYTRSAVGLLARTKMFTEGRFIGMKQALGVKS